MDDLAGVADPAHEEDSAGVADWADQQDSAVSDSARDAGPVAQGTPAGTTPARDVIPDQQGDTTMGSEAPSWLFPSFQRQIKQTNLFDLMSIWTLMQHRMDGGMPVPEPSPGPLFRHLHPEMTRLLPEGLGLQWDGPGGWTSPGFRPGPGLPSEDHHLQNLLPGMLLQSISQPPLTQPRTWKTSLSLMKTMTRDPRGKCQQHNIDSFAKLSLRLRALSRSTQPSLAGLPGRRFWIWGKLKWQTESHGWTSRH